MRSLRAPVALVALLAACQTDLVPATTENVEDTATMYALSGTAIALPSGFAIDRRRPERTDTTSQWDFAFNITPQGDAYFYPLASLGLGASGTPPGFQTTDRPWDDIDEAPLEGYFTRDSFPLAPGTRLIARSRVICVQLAFPHFAKIEVLAIDPVQRSVTFRFLANNNCGYQSLKPGLPDT